MTTNAQLSSQAITVSFPNPVGKIAMPLADSNADTLELLQDIIHRHSISCSTFNSLVYSFFNILPKDLSPEVKTGAQVLAALASSNTNDLVVITVTDDKTNSDLIFNPSLGIGATPVQSSYSAGLLIGLSEIFNNCNFKFYKAKKYFAGEGFKNTVVFAIELNGTMVYFGDLSEMHP